MLELIVSISKILNGGFEKDYQYLIDLRLQLECSYTITSQSVRLMFRILIKLGIMG